jgi:hypothetical protein
MASYFQADQEFHNLLHTARLGVRAAEPVAFGTKRTLLGFVRSCFIITSFIEGASTLAQWSRKANHLAEQRCAISRALGQRFRMLHQARFFLFTAKSKNILVRENTNFPEIFFIDLPYARFVHWRPLARWAQARDLGCFLGNFPRRFSENDKAPLYEAYLRDPFGCPPAILRRRLARAIRANRNQTLISSIVHNWRGRGRKLRNKYATYATFANRRSRGRNHNKFAIIE